MRLRRTLVMRAASILLLAATLVCAVALRGDAGAPVSNLPNAARSSLPFHAASLPQSTAASRIAFAQNGDIYLINPDGTGLTQLTPSGPGYNYQPALSPDGTRVAYGTFQDNQSGISVIDVDGSGLRNLTTNNRTHDSEPAWSPDGSKLAFVRGYDPTAEGVANFTECGPAEIYVVTVDSDDSQIINLTPGENSTDPAWSPDGQRIAFASNRTGNDDIPVNYEIYAVTIEGGEIEQLTHTAAQEAEPAWSLDGKQIAYARDYSRAELPCGWAHTGGPHDPPHDPPLTGGPDIYLMSTDGSNQNGLTATGNNIEPTWSPDGTSLAFVSFRSAAAEIYVLDIKHGTEFSITSNSMYKSSPSWSRADPRLPNDGK